MPLQPPGTPVDHRAGIELSSSAPPVPIPHGHVGEFVIPGTGKLVWWTGRVAIGLRHRPVRCLEPTAGSARWIQDLLLDHSHGLGANRA
jgi:hypothetical protein